jgi:hypothetical protein
MLISTALEGKYVKSSKGQGIIQYADLRKDICGLNEGVYAYACKVRPHWNGEGFPKSDFYTTVYVGVDE